MNEVSGSGLSPVRVTLSNGATVIALASPATPAVAINVWCAAGVMHEPADTPGLANVLAHTIDRGTERRSGETLADELDGRGVTLRLGVDRHALTLTCTCLAEDFADILDIVVDVIRRPAFPAEDVARKRAEIVTEIGQDEDSPAAQASDEVFELLYGQSHPFGRRVKGSIESVERISREALVAFHGRHVTPDGLSLIVVGAIDPARAIDAARARLDDWRRAAPGSPPPPAAPASPGRRRRVRTMMNKSQADLAYGFTTVVRADPSFYAFWVMNVILGQYGLGGRLGDNIREHQGLAYYVYSSFDPALVAAPLVVRAGVDGADVDRTIAAVDGEIRAMARDGVTEAELADARQFLIGSLPRRLETNEGIASFLQTSEFFGLGLDHDRRLPGLIEAVTRDEVHDVARRLDPDRAAIAVAGPYRNGTSP